MAKAENVNVNPEPEEAKLYFTEGASDKVYNAQLEERADGWAVAFQYGKRNRALTAGEKCTGESYENASKIFDKLVLSKMKKGYTDNPDGAVFSSAAHAGKDTGFRPQLLNEISIDEAMELDDGWLFQEKHDGERRPLIADDKGLRYSNKRGLEVGVQLPIAEAFEALHKVVGGELTLDAEDMGDHVIIFDVPKHFMIDSGTFRERAAILAHLEKTIAEQGLSDVLKVDVPEPASTFFAGRLGDLQESNAEGFVARRAESAYVPGQPSSGGDALKIKFWDDVSCRVCEGRAGKRSMGLELINDEGDWQKVGNVTIPSSRDMPEVGDVVDVKYLYAHKGGSIYQPTYRGPRSDVLEDECRMDRLKYKGKPAEPVDDELSMDM
ncbi:MAG: hypothetical protein ABJN42_12295 [Roseibium sp.]|uniref:hypothetical protein n=1 Tax=Roseibium sp. TaxID=1936156 RepID=UPI003298A32B